MLISKQHRRGFGTVSPVQNTTSLAIISMRKQFGTCDHFQSHQSFAIHAFSVIGKSKLSREK